jgi:hypothetical protein
MADGAGAVTALRIQASRSGLSLALGLVLVALCVPTPTRARSVETALVNSFPQFLSGTLRPQGEKLAEQFSRAIAGSFPVTGTSSSHVYRFDPATDTFERAQIPLGPVFSERAESVGAGRLSLGLNYLLVEYDGIDGRSLDALVSRDPTTGGDFLEICGLTACEPVAGLVRLDLEAQILSLSATYGITPDLDLNLFVPFVRTFMRVKNTFIAPDPRVPPEPAFLYRFTDQGSTRETDEGIGDLLLRARYVLSRSGVADVAAGLGISMPTGSTDSLHGTGDVQITTALYVSRTYAERFQPHLNAGFLFDTEKFDRSQARYSAGADIRLTDWLTLNSDFLGRSDVADPDTVLRPVFVQIDRADVFQFSTGLKLAPLARTVLFFNALLPLNDEGVRSDLVLSLGVERVF